ncbi:MAG TPA: DNA-3-methyladenine glycosylase I, partial [Ilumatobacteraceae bacterium]|nr:DNA-3-methyladenine glycosylase I [Ilumatobacteraceae bacterium]
KRENFRVAFAGFDIDTVAAFGPADVERLLGDAGIVRHRGKIESTLNNAQRARDVRDEFGSLHAYVSQFRPEPRRIGSADEIPPLTPESTAMSKDLKKRGWSFVGPTTVYAFMQSMGLVNDHILGCEREP